MAARAERFKVFTVTNKNVNSAQVAYVITQILELPEGDLKFHSNWKKRPGYKSKVQDFKPNRDRNPATEDGKQELTETYIESEIYRQSADGKQLVVAASPKLEPGQYSVLVNVNAIKNGELTEEAIKVGLKAATWRQHNLR